MRVRETALPGVLVVEPKVFGDARGWFTETWSEARYREAGIALPFVQDNLSQSARGTLRGLHLQWPFGQGKLVWVVEGEVLDVAVDVRRGSPTFGRWVAETLSSENHLQLWIPPGFAHGFQVTSERALFAYKCTDRYEPRHELGVRFDDPDLALPWPIRDATVSDKDRALPRLSEVPREALPPSKAARDDAARRGRWHARARLRRGARGAGRGVRAGRVSRARSSLRGVGARGRSARDRADRELRRVHGRRRGRGARGGRRRRERAGRGSPRRACRRGIGAAVVHFGTDYVFDGRARAPYRVDAPLAPAGAYGRSKARGERALRERGAAHLYVRTSWLYAPWSKNFVRTIAALADARPELRVVDDQRGRPTSAEHLARATLELWDRGARGTFHVTDGGECTWFEFAREVVRLRGASCRVVPCTTAEFPRPAPRPAYSVLNLYETEALLGATDDWRVRLADVVPRLEP